MNNHLLKLDINADFIIFILVVALIYSLLLFACGLFIRKFSVLYTILQFIYCVLNSITILIFCGLFTYFLGNAGIIIFSLLFITFLVYGSYKLMVNDDGIYVFNVGKIPEWICDNYESKRKFYIELNNEYKKFKQYNEEII
jgi:hypothetical protein